MKKLFAILLVAVIMVSELLACGGGSNSSGIGSGNRMGFLARLRQRRQSRRSSIAATTTTSYYSTTATQISTCPSGSQIIVPPARIINPKMSGIGQIEIVVPVVNADHNAVDILTAKIAEQIATNNLVQLAMNETNASNNLVAIVNIVNPENILIASIK